MKKTIIALLLSLPFVGFSQSSDYVYPHFKLGFRGGLNLTSLTDFDNNLNYSLQGSSGIYYSPASQSFGPALNAGLAAQIAFSPLFSLQPEANYFQGGGDYSLTVFGGSTSGTIDMRVRLNYIQIPLLAKLSLGNGNVKFNLFGGPAFAFTLNGKMTAEAKAMGNSRTFSQDLKVEDGGLSSLDVQAVVGAGLTIEAGSGDFIIDLRYIRGFSDINNYGNMPIPSFIKPNYNSVIGINVGYLFYIP